MLNKFGIFTFRELYSGHYEGKTPRAAANANIPALGYPSFFCVSPPSGSNTHHPLLKAL